MRVKILENGHYYDAKFGNHVLIRDDVIQVKIDEEDGTTNYDFFKVIFGTSIHGYAMVKSMERVSREDRKNTKVISLEDISNIKICKSEKNFASNIFSI